MKTCANCNKEYPDFIKFYGNYCPDCKDNFEPTHKAINANYKPVPNIDKELLGNMEKFAYKYFKENKNLETVTVVKVKGEKTYRREEIMGVL